MIIFASTPLESSDKRVSSCDLVELLPGGNYFCAQAFYVGRERLINRRLTWWPAQEQGLVLVAWLHLDKRIDGEYT